MPVADPRDFQDPIAALIEHLKVQEAITDLTDRRIFGDALPPEAGMPDYAYTIRWSGGGAFEELATIIRPRLEVRAYGKTDQDAARLYWRAFGILHGLENLIVGNARILSILFDPGPAALIDETLNTPFKLGFMSVIAQFGDP